MSDRHVGVIVLVLLASCSAASDKTSGAGGHGQASGDEPGGAATPKTAGRQDASVAPGNSRSDGANGTTDGGLTKAPPPTVVDPSMLDGYASVPRDQIATMPGTAAGPVTSLTSAPGRRTQVRWTLTVDDKGTARSFVVELPGGLPFPAAVGDTLTVKASRYGGGPNVIPQLVVTDSGAGLRLAINLLPDGWKADYGRKLSTEKGSSYDADNFAVAIQPPGADSPATLLSTWTAVTLQDRAFVGTGQATRRNLHGKRAPPDYVGAWIDYSLVRASTSP